MTGLPLTDNQLGRTVRDAWVAWAGSRPRPKPSHLVPWGPDLPAEQRVADILIGRAVAAVVLHAAGEGPPPARAALPAVPPGTPGSRTFHIARGSTAACDPGLPLDPVSERLAELASRRLRCQRDGCDLRWPGMVPDFPGYAASVTALLEHQRNLAAESAAAGAALTALRRQQTPVRHRGPQSTWPLLRAMFAELGPGARFTTGDALAWLHAHDWSTAADQPPRAAASALSQMLRNGELTRESRAVYRTLPA